MILYEVYDPKTEELIAKGTVAECAEQLCMTVSGFRNAVDRAKNGTNRSQKIVAVGHTEVKQPNRNFTSEKQAAIDAWDAFCEPIRKKYGIPVRRMTKEELEGKGRGK